MNAADTAIVVDSLVLGGVAETDGRLVPGDRLMFVNEQDVRHVSLQDAVHILKGLPQGPVRIEVVKCLVDSDEADEQSSSPSSHEDEDVVNVVNAKMNTLPAQQPLETLSSVDIVSRQIASASETALHSTCNSSISTNSSQCTPPTLGVAAAAALVARPTELTRLNSVPQLPASLERTIRIHKTNDSLGTLISCQIS